MKARDLEKLGIPKGGHIKLAQKLLRGAARAGLRKQALRDAIGCVVQAPGEHVGDPHFGALAELLLEDPPPARYVQRDPPAPWQRWGVGLDNNAIRQMDNACRLPVAVAGALMPDAHLGYGLPIGGVFATDGAVVPYAVGMDIACRMRLSVLDLPVRALGGDRQRLARVLETDTRFGLGAHFEKARDHEVMERDWTFSVVTRHIKDLAAKQLGSSGSGNHFVEFGTLTLDHADMGLDPGTYVALLSHGGSRGPGGKVAKYYSILAESLHPDLPKELKPLAWLELATEAGQEYWKAMELMGAFAAANHEVIHRSIARRLRTKAITTIENHHNFAWLEQHQGREVVVHRKGATPAGTGAMAIIPGSMATPGYVVRGRGNPASLMSASHGAGRALSRKKTRATFRWSSVNKMLAERDVTVLSAGLDEVPGAYKDIEAVMEAQRDLVDIVARFDPKIVKMAPDPP